MLCIKSRKKFSHPLDWSAGKRFSILPFQFLDTSLYARAFVVDENVSKTEWS